jgi:CRP/FNR family transcriptional regulator
MFQVEMELPQSLSSLGLAFASPSAGTERVEFRERSSIYEPTTPARKFYYIETGQVRTYQLGQDGATRLMDIFGPGDWFGIASLARSQVHGSRAIAAAPTILWELPIDRLSELLCQQPEVAREVVAQLASRLLSAQDAAACLVFDDCNQRLIRALIRFSQSAAATRRSDGTVELHITHQQLAQAVGAARETVSLALTQLRQQRLLQTGRNRLLFNPTVLESFTRRAPEPQMAGVGEAN